MITQGDSGGGGVIQPGGTAGTMCAISPSDNISTLGNLLSRIEKLELALSQVLGANLHASTLGDISSQVGWVYGVDYMGVPGWIRTEANTLIPPAGFTFLGAGLTLSDGNTYNAVYYDENGVLQFGFGTDGTISGSQAPPTKFAIITKETDAPIFNWVGGTDVEYPRLRELYDPSNLVDIDNDPSPMFIIQRSGYYNVSITANLSSTGISVFGASFGFMWDLTQTDYRDDPNGARGPSLIFTTDMGSNFNYASASRLMYLQSGSQNFVQAFYDANSGAGTFLIGPPTITLHLIKE